VGRIAPPLTYLSVGVENQGQHDTACPLTSRRQSQCTLIGPPGLTGGGGGVGAGCIGPPGLTGGLGKADEAALAGRTKIARVVQMVIPTRVNLFIAQSPDGYKTSILHNHRQPHKPSRPLRPAVRCLRRAPNSLKHAPVVVVVADRNERRNITAGQKALAHAMLFPGPEKGGRGKKLSQKMRV
jgi:hypothetical protein